MEPKGRNKNPLAQFPSLGTLLNKLCAESSTVLLIMNIIPALTVQFCLQSCQKEIISTEGSGQSERDAADSTSIELTSIMVDYYTKSKLEDPAIEKLDIFIYDNTGTRPLLSHQVLDADSTQETSEIPLQGHLQLTFPLQSSSSSPNSSLESLFGSSYETSSRSSSESLFGSMYETSSKTDNGTGSEITIVIIANCPKVLNDQALARFDSMNLLEFALTDDRPESPILSGMATISADYFSGTSSHKASTLSICRSSEHSSELPSELSSVRSSELYSKHSSELSSEFSGSGPEPARCQIELTPLLSRVIISAVTNGLSDYELLENPQVRLHGLTPSAKVLQYEEFRPVETIESGTLQPLPCDIGFYTQYPNLSLYCYPNDTPETTLGTPRTSLEFTCKIKGLECSFPISLPPIPRNSITRVELTINGPTDYTADIY